MDVSLSGMVVVVTGGSQGMGEAIGRLAAGGCGAGPDRARCGEGQGGSGCPWRACDLCCRRSEATGGPGAGGQGSAAPVLTDRPAGERGGDDRPRGDAARGCGPVGPAVRGERPRTVSADAGGDPRHDRAGGAAGSIVNNLSMNAQCRTPVFAVCAATRGALATLTKNAAHAHLADRVRDNGILMGRAASPAEQPVQAGTLGKGANWAALVAAEMPLNRLLTNDEVARLAVFLLSDASGLMTGTLIDMEQKAIGA